MKFNNVYLATALVLFLILGLLSCNKQNSTDNLNDIIKWERVVAFKEYVDPEIQEGWPAVGEDSDMPNCWVHLEILYPTISDIKYVDLRDSIAKILIQRVTLKPISEYTKEAFQQVADDYVEEQLQDYKLDIQQAHDLHFDLHSLSVFNKQVDVCDSLVYNDKNIVSILYITQEYSGGVHSNEYVTMFNYDMAHKCMITPSSLFKDPNDPGLKALLLNKLMATFDVSSPSELEYAGVYSYEALEVSRNFYFSNTGITFYYNPYELAAYAVGAIEISVTYEELSPYLHKEYAHLKPNESTR